MVRSTVGNSLASAIGYIGGGYQQEEADLAGQLLLNQQRSALIEGQRLQNEAAQEALDRARSSERETENWNVLTSRGVVNRGDDGRWQFDFENASEDDYRLMFEGADIFKTIDPDGNLKDVSFAGFRNAPTPRAKTVGLGMAVAPNQRSGLLAAPATVDTSDYLVPLLRTEDGNVRAMTENATSDDNDAVIRLTRGQVEDYVSDRMTIMLTRGAARNKFQEDEASRQLFEAFSNLPPNQQQRAVPLAAIQPKIEEIAAQDPAAARLATAAVSEIQDPEELNRVAREDFGVTDEELDAVNPLGAALDAAGEGMGESEQEMRRQLIAENDRIRAQMEAIPRGRRTRGASGDYNALAARLRDNQQKLGRLINRERLAEIEEELAQIQNAPRNRGTQGEFSQRKRQLRAERDELLLSGPSDIFGTYNSRDLPPLPDSIRDPERVLDTVTTTSETAIRPAVPTPEEIRGPRPAGLPPAIESALPEDVQPTQQGVTDAVERGQMPNLTPEQTTGFAEYLQSQGVNTAQDLARLPAGTRETAIYYLAALEASNDPAATRANLQALFNIAGTGNPSTTPDDVRNTDIAALNAQTSFENAVTARESLDLRSRQLQFDIGKANRGDNTKIMERAQEFNTQAAAITDLVTSVKSPMSDEGFLGKLDSLDRLIKIETDPAVRQYMAGEAANLLYRGLVKTAANQNDGFFGIVDLFKPDAATYQYGADLRKIEFVRDGENIVRMQVLTRAPDPSRGETTAPETASELTYEQMTRFMSPGEITYLADYIDKLKEYASAAYRPPQSQR